MVAAWPADRAYAIKRWPTVKSGGEGLEWKGRGSQKLPRPRLTKAMKLERGYFPWLLGTFTVTVLVWERFPDSSFACTVMV